MNPFVFTIDVTATCEYLFAFVTVATTTREFGLYMSKMDVSWILGSLGGYATESFSCNYFVFDPIYLETYK